MLGFQPTNFERIPAEAPPEFNEDRLLAELLLLNAGFQAAEVASGRHATPEGSDVGISGGAPRGR